MRVTALGLITMRRELGARYAHLTRQWLAAASAYRRLHAAQVQRLGALRAAAQRLERLGRGRAALLSDLKSLSD